jgi:hypothetical protein
LPCQGLLQDELHRVILAKLTVARSGTPCDLSGRVNRQATKFQAFRLRVPALQQRPPDQQPPLRLAAPPAP